MLYFFPFVFAHEIAPIRLRLAVCAILLVAPHKLVPERISRAYFLFSLYQLLITDRVIRGKYLATLSLSDSACTSQLQYRYKL